LPVFLGAVHLDFQPLLSSKVTEKFGWRQNFGLYPLEKDERGFLFQWGGKTAGIVEANLGPVMTVPVKASHPDIGKKPVRVRVYSADRYFRKGALVKELVLKESRWVNFWHRPSSSSEDLVRLIFEADRAWQPLKDLGAPDPRWLGMGLGMIFYKYPKNLVGEKIRSAKRISAESWQGKAGGQLHVNGTSRLRFETTGEYAALRLGVRGQKAFDIGPYLVVRLDGRVIGRAMVSEDGWTSLVFRTRSKPGGHELSVEYLNDFSQGGPGQDRNAFLGDLEVLELE
jgi:hypothetical protein